MAEIDFLQAAYVKLREEGLEPKTALSSLRAEIVALDIIQREKLIEKLRSWELSTAAASAKPANNPPDFQPAATTKQLETIQFLIVSDMEEGKPAPHVAQTPLPD
jgi:hypothetical protein